MQFSDCPSFRDQGGLNCRDILGPKYHASNAQKGRPAHQNLHELRTALRMAKKMASDLGARQNLLREMST